MNRYFILLIGIAAMVGILFTMLSRRPVTQRAHHDKLQIATSFYPLYYLAREIGGDQADVVNITPSGAEPHDYEPSARDIARIYESDVLILIGNTLEPWGVRIRSDVPPTTHVLVVGDEYANQNMDEEGHIVRDPHIWLSPRIAHQMAIKIRDEYIARDPARRDYFTSRTTVLLNTLDTIDNVYRRELATCTQRTFITSHAAFGYVAHEYGLEQVAISGLSPDAEPSVKRLAAVADMARQNNIHTIFFESLISPKLSETIAREVGATSAVLDPIEGVSDQDMQSGLNYATIMYSNLRNLRAALSCQ